MEENPEYQIQVLPMAEAPSSEATILTAIAGGTAPAASENIFIGFGAELWRAMLSFHWIPSQAGTSSLPPTNMEEAIKSWAFLMDILHSPIYSNPILYGWRIDIFGRAGQTAFQNI